MKISVTHRNSRALNSRREKFCVKIEKKGKYYNSTVIGIELPIIVYKIRRGCCYNLNSYYYGE